MKNIVSLILLVFVISCSRDESLNLERGTSSELLSKNSYSRMSINSEINTRNWMRLLDDNTLLKDLTIVGSHDAGAYRKGGSLAITQNSDIKTQLESGVRYLDIRLNYEIKKQSLVVYHGIVSQQIDFNNDVLNVINSFLESNPTEMVFLVVKNESGKYSKEWKEKIEKEFSKYASRILDSYSTYTRLKEARGKIAVISRVGSLPYANALYGYKDNDASFGNLGFDRVYFSDKYNIPNILASSIHQKANVIFDGIYKAQQLGYRDNWMIINANASSAFAHPINVANKINPMIVDYLSKHIYKPYNKNVSDNFISKRSGFIIIDFTTSEVGKKIIDLCIRQSILSNNINYQKIYNKEPGYIE